MSAELPEIHFLNCLILNAEYNDQYFGNKPCGHVCARKNYPEIKINTEIDVYSVHKFSLFLLALTALKCV